MKKEIRDKRRFDKLKKSQAIREAMMIVNKTKECTAMDRKLLRTRDKDKDTVVALYELLENFGQPLLEHFGQPYVTWLAPKNAPENTFWGHYFDNVVDAVHDFESR